MDDSFVMSERGEGAGDVLCHRDVCGMKISTLDKCALC